MLFSSVSVRQLLIAKILALGAAGLLQVIVWLISAPTPTAPGFLHFFRGFLSDIQLPANFIVLGNLLR